jgi:ATP-dependent DNA helicase RecG
VEGKRRPYRTRDGRFYLRIGAEKREASREELAALLEEARPLRYESVPVIGATIKNIDEGHLWSFLRKFAGDALDETNATGAAGYPTATVLERELLLATSNGTEVVPTTAGLLLFGHDERVPELLPRAGIVATRFAGDSVQAAVVERVKLHGNLATLYESTLRFISRYCDLREARPRKVVAEVVEESPVPARANYHRGAVMEGVANMLTHRDLALRDQPTRLQVFDHSLELINPRRTLGFSPVAQKAIRYGMPERLNPQISAAFSSPAYGLDLPSGGLPMLLRESRLFSGKRTETYAFNDEFRLRLHAL